MMSAFSSTVILLSLLAVCLGQDFDVFVEPGDADQGTSSEITCRYPVVDSSYSFRYLVWRKGDRNGAVDTADIVASYVTGGTPSYPVTSKNYSITTDTISSSCTLSVESLEFPADEGRYWCSVQFRLSGSAHMNGVNFTLLVVRVPPTRIMLSDSKGVEYPSSGGKVSLMVGEDLDFTCKVPDINPGAVFTWMVGTVPLGGGSSSNNPEVGLGNLTTSTSVYHYEAKKDHDKQLLKCSASNKEGDPGLSISVELSITDPCQDNPCENGGTCTSWNGMPNCTCTEQFTGVNCTEIVPTTPPPEPTQPTGTDGKPPTVPTTPPEPTQPTGTDGKPTEATDQPLSVAAIAGISCGCVLAGLCLIGIGIYLCYTYDCCIWCGEHCPWCREHCSCCRKPPKDGGNRDENIGMNNTGDERH